MSQSEANNEVEELPEEIPVDIENDLQHKVAEAFLIFDHAGNKTVDVREIGTILRGLGCCPSEAEIDDILFKTEDRACTGVIHLANFLPQVCPLITAHKMQPATPEKLLEAFRCLDPENKGFLTKEHLSKLMMEECEPFVEEELEEMMVTAYDCTSGNIPYEYYINQLMVD